METMGVSGKAASDAFMASFAAPEAKSNVALVHLLFAPETMAARPRCSANITRFQGGADAHVHDVRIFMAWDGSRSFTVTVSYDLALATTLQPVTDRIVSSLRWE